jgi:hypothetical protein
MEGSLLSVKNIKPMEATIELSIGQYSFEQICIEFTYSATLSSSHNLPHFHKLGQSFMIDKNAQYVNATASQYKNQKRKPTLNFENNLQTSLQINRNCDASVFYRPLHQINKKFSVAGKIVSYRESALKIKDANYQ